jgi:hypothetical protein
MVTRSQQYACNRLNGATLVERSWTQKAEKTYDCQTKTRDPHGDLAPEKNQERLSPDYLAGLWKPVSITGHVSKLLTASRTSSLALPLMRLPANSYDAGSPPDSNSRKAPLSGAVIVDGFSEQITVASV